MAQAKQNTPLSLELFAANLGLIRMCGRYTLRKFPNVVELLDHKSIPIIGSDLDSEFEPRFNIAPSQSNFILRPTNLSEELEKRSMRWGLVPSWSKTTQMHSPLINARSETIAEKPAFKAAFLRRRCLVPADGFYEWKKSRSGSTPFHFSMKDDSVFFMAGIWETWHGELGESLESYTILTTDANALLSKYHDRMPVILASELIEKWLRPVSNQHDIDRSREFYSPFEAKHMKCTPANPQVNNNTCEGPVCLEAPEKQPVDQLDLNI